MNIDLSCSSVFYRKKTQLTFTCLKPTIETLEKGEPSTALIDGSSIESNTKEILLGITIDRDLKFDEYINNLCEKACQKLLFVLHLS